MLIHNYLLKLLICFLLIWRHRSNIQNLLKQGLEPGEIEDIVNRKLYELDPIIVSIEFILNLESIADTVQPQTDKFLNKL